jgi:hypothetical protein
MNDHIDMFEYGDVRQGEIATRGRQDADAISANDVNQGALGSCYFLSALMSLAAQQPDLIRKAITGPLSDGTYNVRLYTKQSIGRGKKFTAHELNVSASFLMDQKNEGEAYARGGDRDAAGNTELWVKLIEKAFAVLNGGFQQVDSGYEIESFEALTGKDYATISMNGGIVPAMAQADVTALVQRMLAEGHGIAASTYPKWKFDEAPGSGKDKSLGLFPLHSYAIMAADDSTITVRDPYGDAEGVAAEIRLTWAQFRYFFKNFTSADLPDLFA